MRKSGQDIGNPNPPASVETTHIGHKADADSWLRTKSRRYKRKQAEQRITKGAQDKFLFEIVAAHHRN